MKTTLLILAAATFLTGCYTRAVVSTDPAPQAVVVERSGAVPAYHHHYYEHRGYYHDSRGWGGDYRGPRR